MYLRGKRGWLQHCSPAHNNQSTVLHEDDRYELRFAPGHRDCLYRHSTPLRYALPLFYGLFKNQTYIAMFDRTSGIRLTHSPSGGGFNKEFQTTLPAWDFQFITPHYEILTDYSFRCRLAYRPRCSREEVLKEYEGWKKELG